MFPREVVKTAAQKKESATLFQIEKPKKTRTKPPSQREKRRPCIFRVTPVAPQAGSRVNKDAESLLRYGLPLVGKGGGFLTLARRLSWSFSVRFG